MKKYFAVLIIALMMFQCVDDYIEGTCSTPATIKDLSGLDGCGYVLELEDGTYLQPYMPVLYCGTPPLPKEVTEDPLFNFRFEDGKKVFISYSILKGHFNTCMAGSLAKITCIREANASSNPSNL